MVYKFVQYYGKESHLEFLFLVLHERHKDLEIHSCLPSFCQISHACRKCFRSRIEFLSKLVTIDSQLRGCLPFTLGIRLVHSKGNAKQKFRTEIQNKIWRVPFPRIFSDYLELSWVGMA